MIYQGKWVVCVPLRCSHSWYFSNSKSIKASECLKLNTNRRYSSFSCSGLEQKKTSFSHQTKKRWGSNGSSSCHLVSVCLLWPLCDPEGTSCGEGKCSDMWQSRSSVRSRVCDCGSCRVNISFLMRIFISEQPGSFRACVSSRSCKLCWKSSRLAVWRFSSSCTQQKN